MVPKHISSFKLLSLTHIITMTLKDLSTFCQPHIFHVPNFNNLISPGTKKTMAPGNQRPYASTVTSER